MATSLEKTFAVLTALQKAQMLVLTRNVPKNNPAARDFFEALKNLVKALEDV